MIRGYINQIRSSSFTFTFINFLFIIYSTKVFHSVYFSYKNFIWFFGNTATPMSYCTILHLLLFCTCLGSFCVVSFNISLVLEIACFEGNSFSEWHYWFICYSTKLFMLKKYFRYQNLCIIKYFCNKNLLKLLIIQEATFHPASLQFWI